MRSLYLPHAPYWPNDENPDSKTHVGRMWEEWDHVCLNSIYAKAHFDRYRKQHPTAMCALSINLLSVPEKLPTRDHPYSFLGEPIVHVDQKVNGTERLVLEKKDEYYANLLSGVEAWFQETPYHLAIDNGPYHFDADETEQSRWLDCYVHSMNELISLCGIYERTLWLNGFGIGTGNRNLSALVDLVKPGQNIAFKFERFGMNPTTGKYRDWSKDATVVAKWKHPQNVFHLAPQAHWGGPQIQNYLHYWLEVWRFFHFGEGHISGNDFFHYRDGDPELWRHYPILGRLNELKPISPAYLVDPDQNIDAVDAMARAFESGDDCMHVIVVDLRNEKVSRITFKDWADLFGHLGWALGL